MLIFWKGKIVTYKLPHDLDRPHQAEVLKWILESKKKYLILCAPTGFGKSPLPAATSLDFRTLVLVLHKSLQSTNYRDQYNFDILYGKSNYPCLESDQKAKQLAMFDRPRLTAFDCSNPDCFCPYQKQEWHCLNSDRVSLNYAKFLMSRPFTKELAPQYLFLDEAHNLLDIVTDFVGLTLRWDNEFLKCPGDIQPKKEMMLNINEALALFRQCARAVESNKPIRETEDDLKVWRRWKRLSQSVAVFNDIISVSEPKDWYFETTEEKLILKPLTSKYHFKSLFDVSEKVVLMSATIRPSIAARLGLDEDEFDFMEVPSNWPIPGRLVYDLGGPAINYRSSDEDKQEQSKLIASVLEPDKSGIIHVMSRYQARKLQQSLYEANNYFDFIEFVIPDEKMSTEQQLEWWQSARAPGVYCISWNFREGVDLREDDINIVAKTPFAGLSGGYEKAKKDLDPQWYLEKTAYGEEQALGRHQRGEPGHYAKGAKLSFIADSSYYRIKDYLSSDFKARIRRYAR